MRDSAFLESADATRALPSLVESPADAPPTAVTLEAAYVAATTMESQPAPQLQLHEPSTFATAIDEGTPLPPPGAEQSGAVADSAQALSANGADGEPLAAEVRRVMVGRVELVTPQQRQRLAQIARGPASNPHWLFNAINALGGGRQDMYREDWFKMLMNGRQTFAGLHVQVPSDYREYLKLGRFRNALILDELSKRQTPPLKTFVQAYTLGS